MRAPGERNTLSRRDPELLLVIRPDRPELVVGALKVDVVEICRRGAADYKGGGGSGVIVDPMKISAIQIYPAQLVVETLEVDTNLSAKVWEISAKGLDLALTLGMLCSPVRSELTTQILSSTPCRLKQLHSRHMPIRSW